MATLPRFRLRTIFLVFVCAAVGLAGGGGPSGILLGAIVTAIIIGLAQQTWRLWSWQPAAGATTSDEAFARWFAIAWRAVVVLSLGSTTVIELWLRSYLLEAAEAARVRGFSASERALQSLFLEVLPGFFSVCVVVVLCNSVGRWRRPSRARPSHRWRAVILWMIAVAVGLITVVDQNLIPYLVHRATANIEAAIPPALQRPGVYANLQEEGYLSFWVGLAAAVSVVAAGAAFAWSFRGATTTSARRWWSGVTAVLVALQVGFCYWYYAAEFHRLSPDLAGAGLEANWTQWLAGGILASVLNTAGAYRLARSHAQGICLSTDLAHDIDRTAFHESFPCLITLGAEALVSCFLLIAGFLSIPHFGGTARWAGPWISTSYFFEPSMLLMIAMSLAGLQLCWVRWRRRSEAVAWELPTLPPGRFCAAWLGLAVILVVGVATLNAFAFIFWLGPFNFLGI